MLFLLLLGVTIIPLAAPEKANAAAFTCSTDFYWVVDNGANTQMYSGDPATNDLTTPLGPTSAVGGYNAIGYNVQDNFIWGFSTEGATMGQLVRVHSDGTSEIAYPSIATGLPVASYQAAAFDKSGILWTNALFGQENVIYGVNVATNTAVALPLSTSLPTIRIVDFAYVDGYLYTTSGGNTATDLRTYRIDLSNGDVTVSNPMTGMNLTGDYMDYSPSLWSTVEGNIYMYYAEGTASENGIYEIVNYDTPNPSFILRNNIEGQSSGDGASCVNAATPFSIEADDDDFSSNPIQTCSGGVAGNIFDNDTLYGDGFDPSSVSLTVENDGGLTGVTLNQNGNVVIPPECITPNTYTVVYQICDVVSPDVCNTASITLRIVAASTNPNTLADTGISIFAPLLSSGVLLTAAGVVVWHVRPSHKKYRTKL